MAYLIYAEYAVRYRLSHQAKQQVKQYDKDRGFVPGPYWLQAPSNSETLGAKRDANRKRHEPHASAGRRETKTMVYIRGRAAT
jgi:hypothetical protein